MYKLSLKDTVSHCYQVRPPGSPEGDNLATPGVCLAAALLAKAGKKGWIATTSSTGGSC